MLLLYKFNTTQTFALQNLSEENNSILQFDFSNGLIAGNWNVRPIQKWKFNQYLDIYECLQRHTSTSNKYAEWLSPLQFSCSQWPVSLLYRKAKVSPINLCHPGNALIWSLLFWKSAWTWQIFSLMENSNGSSNVVVIRLSHFQSSFLARIRKTSVKPVGCKSLVAAVTLIGGLWKCFLVTPQC